MECLPMAMINKALLMAGGYVLADAAVTHYFHNRGQGATSGFGKDLKHLKGKDGFILAKKQQLSLTKTCEGIFIIGPTGEKKSVSLFYSNLLSNHFPKSSIIVHDAKGELFYDTKDYQGSIGRIPILFEPLGNKAYYNPLDFCDNLTEVRELATNILNNGSLAVKLASGSGSGGNDAFWINSCVPLFTAALLYVKDLHSSQSNIAGAISFLTNTEEKEITEKFSKCQNRDVKEQYNKFLASSGANETIGSILATFQANTHLFTDHDLIRSTCKSTFNPKMLREKPIILYVKYDPLKAEYLAPFIAIFYTQLINKVMSYYIPGITLPTIVMLDEFQNLGKIASLSSIVSTCRYVEMPLIVAVQSISKLYSIYGKYETDTVLGNLKTKCVLPSISEVEAMRYASELCGYVEVPEVRDGKTFKIKKKLLEYDEVRRIPKDKIVIIAHNLLPIMADQNTYFTDINCLRNKVLGGLDL